MRFDFHLRFVEVIDRKPCA